jgi:predicted pyridoxine 5'-phosphate oxidase superfamily flavin-nucleotide-binding protein
MATITQDMKNIEAKAKFHIIATASKEGKPNGVPIGFAKIISDDAIMLVDTLMYKTRQNIAENPRVAISFWSQEDHYGYQLKGISFVETSGKLFDEAIQWLKDRGSQSRPKSVILVKVDEAYYIGRGKDSSKNLV